jgi:hypothetical protein
LIVAVSTNLVYVDLLNVKICPPMGKWAGDEISEIVRKMAGADRCG